MSLWRLPISDSIVADQRDNNIVLSHFNTNVTTIYLETGSAGAGLEHIFERHKVEFTQILGQTATPDLISNYLKEFLQNGRYKTYGFKIRTNNGKKELSVIYQIDAKKFLLLAIGSNGFIVSSMPTDSSSADDTDY